jgi:hypothetical protein
MAYVTFLVQVTCVTSDILVQLSGLEAKNIVDLRLDLGGLDRGTFEGASRGLLTF